MGDEAYGRDIGLDIGRDGGHHVAVFVQRYFHAKGLELVSEHFEKVPLLGGRRLRFTFFVALGVYAHVAQKTV